MVRRILTLGLCAAYLAFGSVAGVAHIHGAAGHHQESRGVHLDHAHLDDHGHGHARNHDDGTRDPGRHVDHHEGDAVDVPASAIVRLPNVRVFPAIAAAETTIDHSSLTRETGQDRPSQPSEPRRKIPPRLRAPPA